MCATEHWNWDTWTGEEKEDYGEEEYDGEENVASGPHCDDDNFIVSRLMFTESIILSSAGRLYGAGVCWRAFFFFWF